MNVYRVLEKLPGWSIFKYTRPDKPNGQFLPFLARAFVSMRYYLSMCQYSEYSHILACVSLMYMRGRDMKIVVVKVTYTHIL